jgi:hypothetical protein
LLQPASGSAERPRVGLPWPVGAAVESVSAEGRQRWPLFRRRSGWVPVDCGAAPEPEKVMGATPRLPLGVSGSQRTCCDDHDRARLLLRIQW